MVPGAKLESQQQHTHIHVHIPVFFRSEVHAFIHPETPTRHSRSQYILCAQSLAALCLSFQTPSSPVSCSYRCILLHQFLTYFEPLYTGLKLEQTQRGANEEEMKPKWYRARAVWQSPG